MLETYSNATVNDCSFIENTATDDGGAVYSRRRSQLIIVYSYLQSNKALNSGGSILVQHSLAIVSSSTFENESSVLGYGGSISAEHVGNVTIDSCEFINCTAVHGGSVSIRAESILRVKRSLYDSSFSTTNGGGMYISKSFVQGYNIVIKNSKSIAGSAIFLDDLGQMTIGEFYFKANKANKSGGAIYCKNSEISFEFGGMEFNYAKSSGGAVFAHYYQVTFDYVTSVNNTAEINAGAINSEASTIDIHNCEANGNSAEKKGEFAMITSNSKLTINYLILINIKSNSIIITDRSEAKLRHVYLPHAHVYCPITAVRESQIHVIAIHMQGTITGEISMNSHNERTDICKDSSSFVKDTPTGILIIYTYEVTI